MPIPLQIQDNCFMWGKKTYIMGILNVTPDSFSDGGEFNSLESALQQARKLVAQGANIIDIGGQSTRPGAPQISELEEFNRVIPIIKTLRQELSIPISIDTTRASIAEAAIMAGANLINDISAGSFDQEMFSVASKLDVPIILMHIRGTPETMQQLTNYEDVVREIYQFLEDRIKQALATGMRASHLIIDPGIGFAKTHGQNLEILRRLKEFTALDLPILIGVSRKSFLGYLLNQPEAKQRIWGTAAACSIAIAGGADILRVHDVAPIYDVCRITDAIYRHQRH